MSYSILRKIDEDEIPGTPVKAPIINWSNGDTMRLLKIVEELKIYDGTCKRNSHLFRKAAVKFNLIATDTRTWDQIRARWKRLKLLYFKGKRTNDYSGLTKKVYLELDRIMTKKIEDDEERSSDAAATIAIGERAEESSQGQTMLLYSVPNNQKEIYINDVYSLHGAESDRIRLFDSTVPPIEYENDDNTVDEISQAPPKRIRAKASPRVLNSRARAASARKRSVSPSDSEDCEIRNVSNIVTSTLERRTTKMRAQYEDSLKKISRQHIEYQKTAMNELITINQQWMEKQIQDQRNWMKIVLDKQNEDMKEMLGNLTQTFSQVVQNLQQTAPSVTTSSIPITDTATPD